MQKRFWVLWVACLAGCWAVADGGAAALDSARRDPFLAEHQALGLNAKDLTVERKEPSWWWRPRCASAAEQWAYAEGLEQGGSLRRARNAYNDLVHEWGASPYAGRAQHRIAEISLKRGDLERAYEEYVYLIAYFAGQCPYEQVLDSCFRTANAILGENRSFLGLPLASDAFHRENFERILFYAPRWHKAPEVLIRIGALHEADSDYALAAKVYDTIIARFPKSNRVEDAAYRSAWCHRELARREKEHLSRCRDSILAIRALTNRFPEHPRLGEFKRWIAELERRYEDLRFAQAAFYDQHRYGAKAALGAYAQFLKEFPASVHAEAITNRMAELKAQPAAR